MQPKYCLTSLGREMVEKHMPLALSILGRTHYGHRLHRDDRMQVAFDALIRAVATFDPELGYAFSTYATQVIYRGLAYEGKTDGVIRRTWNGHAKKTPAILEAWNRAAMVGPLTEDFGRDREASIAVLDREPIPGDDDERDRREWLSRAIDDLPERWATIVRLRNEGMSLQRIGDALGRTKERVRQIETQAREKLQRRARLEFGRES